MHLEKICLDKIQNGRLSAIIHFHMADIWSTVLDGWTITINRNVRFQMRMHLENLKWPPFRPLFIFTWLIFGKPC